MAEEINSKSARQLRTAMKATEGRESAHNDVPECFRGDSVAVGSTFYETGKKDFILLIERNGERVGSVPITRQMLKRLKVQMVHWGMVHSGLSHSYVEHAGLRDMRKDG